EAVAAAEMGVDQIGFVAGDYGVVHGELSFADARRLAQALPAGTTRVALTMATQVDEILRMAAAVEPDIIHISTDLEDVGVAAMAELRRRLPAAVKLMKALAVGGEESLAAARRFAPVSDLFLLDSKGHGLPGIGASGLTHDWSISRRIVEAVNIPVILAGGLSAANVAEAIQAVRPAGVDSNTATNVPGDPVAKDLARLRAFVAAVRGAAQ
ncbi:MAG: phosphoribosylanthranilate isomerase, partial [Anaerolineales bacterium]|nr:phosphoribosylanthranilate isomerase [Anaerolineales bacterium]